MNGRLRVLACRPGATVQDFGRVGLRRYGVAWAGAADRLSLAAANAVCGNPPDAAGVELCLVGAAFQVEDAPVRLAVVGAAAAVDGAPVAADCAVDVQPGSRVDVRAPAGRIFAYLAVAGGIVTDSDMGSRSVHLRSGIGGTALAAGDLLPCGGGSGDGPCMGLRRFLGVDNGPIRAILGPQDDHFDPEAIATLFGTGWMVGARSDRMGLRLEGPALAHARGYNIVSDGVLPGCIQVPGDGAPIVLMRDCQTTGGYPKIATVISADLDRLAQIPPGGTVRLTEVTPDQAAAAARDHARLIAGLRASVGPAGPTLDTGSLYWSNLVSGVHNPLADAAG